MKTITILAGLFLTIAAGPAPAANPTSADVCAQARPAVNSVVGRWLARGEHAPRHRAAGAEVGLYLNGQECYFGYGTTRFGSGQTPTRHTLFEIGSVTKTFTATMLALHEVRNPDFNVHGPINPALIPCAGKLCLKLSNGMQKLTYFELATFTGGLPDAPSNLRRVGGPRDYTQADFIAFLNGFPAPPGGLPASNVYSNTSYGFLGELVMALDGYRDFNDSDAFRAGFDQWIGGGITGTLGMTCTAADTAALPAACNAGTEMATGYRYERGRYIAVRLPWPWTPMGSAGDLRSNAQDLVHYIAAYVGASEVAGATVPADLSRAMALARTPTAVRMPKKPANRQAYAWVVADAADPVNSIVLKNGGVPGFSTCVAMMPAQRAGIVLFATAESIPVCGMAPKMLQEITAPADGANP